MLYGGSDDSFYDDFEVMINDLVFQVSFSSLLPIKKLWRHYPTAPTPEDICICSGITIKVLDVSHYPRDLVAEKLSVTESEVEGVTSIEVLRGTLKDMPLFYTVVQTTKKYLLIFSQGETQPSLYERKLEAAFEIE